MSLRLSSIIDATNRFPRRGVMFVISSASGTGKTTICKTLLANYKDIKMSISVTTRPQRPGEIEGRDYYFVSVERFQEMKKNGELLEDAEVFGNFYGTPKKPVMDALQDGKDILFDIDWQGTQQLSEKAEGDMVRVFILPPSMEELARRLRTRAQDSDEVVAHRLKGAYDEISHYDEYDFVLVNDNIEETTACVESIYLSERLRRKRLTGVADFVRELRYQKI